jgi:DNA topoisomerase-1
MTDMVVDTVTYSVKASSGHTLVAHGQTIKDQGWFAAYPYSKVKDEILPSAKEGEKLDLLAIAESLHSTQPPAKYNDGSLVKRMEEDGIGRPSTRASILKALGDKGYTDKDGKAFTPTELGMKVCDFLTPRFNDFFMDYKFTATLEEDLDLLADGKKNYLDVVKPVYDFLMKKVAAAKASTPKKVAVLAGGKCPSCKTGDVVEKESRYGKFYCCGNFPKCKVILVKKEDGTFIEKSNAPRASTAEKSGKKCPDCGGDLLIRTNHKKGTKFLGCSGYPQCKHAEKIAGEK